MNVFQLRVDTYILPTPSFLPQEQPTAGLESSLAGTGRGTTEGLGGMSGHKQAE